MVLMKRTRAHYSILRYVPNLAREEFVNVGVLLVCPELAFQQLRTLGSFGDTARFKAMPHTDGQYVRHAAMQLRDAVENKALNQLLTKPSDAALEAADLGTLSLLYSSGNLQLSQPRTTATTEPAVTLEVLFQEFVSEAPQAVLPKSVTRQVILRKTKDVFAGLGLFNLGLKERWTVPTPTAPKLDYAYENRVIHGYHAISFVGNEQTVVKDVNSYRMTAREIREDNNLPEATRNAKFTVLGYVPTKSTAPIQNWVAALEDYGIVVVDHEETPEIAKDIARDLHEHQNALQVLN